VSFQALATAQADKPVMISNQ